MRPVDAMPAIRGHRIQDIGGRPFRSQRIQDSELSLFFFFISSSARASASACLKAFSNAFSLSHALRAAFNSLLLCFPLKLRPSQLIRFTFCLSLRLLTLFFASASSSLPLLPSSSLPPLPSSLPPLPSSSLPLCLLLRFLSTFLFFRLCLLLRFLSTFLFFRLASLLFFFSFFLPRTGLCGRRGRKRQLGCLYNNDWRRCNGLSLGGHGDKEGRDQYDVQTDGHSKGRTRF